MKKNIYSFTNVLLVATQTILTFFLTTPSISQTPKNITKVGVGEYFTSYLTDEKKIYATLWNGSRNVFTAFSLTNVIDVDGAQYTNIVLLADGSVKIINKASSGGENILSIPIDSAGNSFIGNSKVYGWFEAFLTIKNDSIYYFGKDYLNIKGGSSVSITSPIKLNQPPGKRVTKIVVSDISADWPTPVTVLCSDGTVWQYSKGSRIPVQKVINDVALDIASIGRAGYVVVTATDIKGWGPYASYLGLHDGLTTPTSILSLWTTAGLTMPVKEIAGNWNSLHIIDANNNMFAQGDNEQGEIGNGQQEISWKVYKNLSSSAPFAWDWGRGQLMQSPIQIRGKVKNLCASNSVAFYFFVQDMNNNWYSWGRNKVYSLGNGVRVTNDNIYPDFGTIPAPKSVNPSTITWNWPEPTFDPAKNLAPIANAGIDDNIQSTSTTLYGEYSSQQSGTITSYNWSQVSGAHAIINNQNSMNTTVTGLTTGIYIFRLTITNNLGLIDTDDITINVNFFTNLPVSLINYNIEISPQNKVLIKWITAQESNNDHFTIERSADGINFSKIGTVAATNNPDGSSYIYGDIHPLNGKNFYRLSQSDLDGLTTYFGVKSITFNNSLQKEISLFPNPVSNTLSLNINNQFTGNIKYSIYNLQGKLVLMKEVIKSSQSLLESFSTQALSAGLYNAVISMGNDFYTSSFIKK